VKRRKRCHSRWLAPLTAFCLTLSCGAATGLFDGDDEDAGGYVRPPVSEAGTDVPSRPDAEPDSSPDADADGFEPDADGFEPDSDAPFDANDAEMPPDAGPDAPVDLTSFANSASNLYSVALPTPDVLNLGGLSQMFLDIAVDPAGTLYGISGGDDLYTVDPTTLALTYVSSTGVGCNALGFGPDGTLYGGAGSNVYTIDPKSGKATLLAPYPSGYGSSGDVAVLGGLLYGTVSGSLANDSVVSIDLSTLETSVVGNTGYSCIFGLSAYEGQLYGFTCNGQILLIDATTAKSTLLASDGASYYGGAALSP
jgi:hypothetical protein